MKTLQTIWQELFQPLSAFGYEKGQGTTRLSWSKPFLEAQQYLRHYGEAIGLQCRRDGWGFRIILAGFPPYGICL